MLEPCKVVAELGGVAVGSIERAKKLIDLAVLCGADYVKFQKRNPYESIPEHLKHQPHPNACFSYGATYLEHRLALEFSIDQHRELKKYCEEHHIGYASSVWDLTSAREIISLSPDYIKVPSACNLNWNLLNVLVNEYEGDIHISTGMITQDEKKLLYQKIKDLDIFSRVVIYHCTSEYPCPFERLSLLELERLKWWGCKLGYSGHNFGISCDILTYMVGCRWIERHFVDDRTFRHTDAAASLEPSGLAKLVRDLKNARLALTYKDEIGKIEMEQRKKLKNEQN